MTQCILSQVGQVHHLALHDKDQAITNIGQHNIHILDFMSTCVVLLVIENTDTVCVGGCSNCCTFTNSLCTMQPPLSSRYYIKHECFTKSYTIFTLPRFLQRRTSCCPSHQGQESRPFPAPLLAYGLITEDTQVH